MAENNNVNRDYSPDVAEDDPFAELARIMNHGTRGEAAAPVEEEQAEADPFSVDLEKELLGDLDESAYAEPGDDLEAAGDHDTAAEPDDYQSAAFAGEDLSADGSRNWDAPYDEAADAAAEQPVHETQDDLPPEAETGDWVAEDAPAADAGWSAEDYRPIETQPVPAERPTPAASDWQPEDGYADAEGSVLADVDMDFGDLDLQAEQAAEEPWQRDEEASAIADQQPVEYDAPAYDEPAPAATAAPAAVSLEDELEMLLAGRQTPTEDHSEQADEAVGYREPLDAGHDYDASPAGFPEPAQPPQSSIFGRANFAHAGANQGWPEAAEADDVPAQAEQDADPFDVLASIAPAEQDDETAHAAAPDMPTDFETVDVPEPALAQADDLDLPDIPQEEPLARDLAGDFESEFTYDFQTPAASPNGDAAHAESVAATEADPLADDDRFYAEALGFSAATHSARGRDQANDIAGDPLGGDFDQDFEAAIAAADTGAGKPGTRPERRKGFLIAGAVLGIAVLGGIGAFALSSGGDEPGSPVLVKADNDPIKVKPKDPGGSQAVPNQDSVAYEAAAGANDGQLPQQESLVSTTEEPINIASRTVETTRLPGVDDELQPEGEGGLSGKAEDRLAAPASDTVSSEIADDVIAVQPRKVRTMIVRPDGTLVPREEVEEDVPQTPEPNNSVAAAAPANTAQTASAETTASAASGEQQGLALGQSGQIETTDGASAASVETAAPATQQETATAQPANDPVTPRVAPVVPTRPAAETVEQPQQVAQAPAAPRTQPAAPTPPAGATSEWSMQIASQPSAESAQATYQELARRYGELLGGRGVNIVRAEIPGKGTYFRVRIPTSSRSDGIELCERYKAAGGSCFVSK